MPIAHADVSPLRYPGSKAFLVDYVDDLLKENYLEQCTFVEPYAGSAVVSLELLKRGTIGDAILVERDPLVFSFWKSVFYHTFELVERVSETPISLETWQYCQQYRTFDVADEARLDREQTIVLGWAGLFLNRTCFSGILGAGPIGGKSQSSPYKIDCRFNKERIIQKIYELSKLRDSVTVRLGDAMQFLYDQRRRISHSHCFIYADPPYFGKGRELYRYWYSSTDHLRLAKYLLSLKAPWLVSYDDHVQVREMYKRAPGRWQVYIDYTVSTSSRRKDLELIISNLPIPPESYRLSLVQLS